MEPVDRSVAGDSDGGGLVDPAHGHCKQQNTNSEKCISLIHYIYIIAGLLLYFGIAMNKCNIWIQCLWLHYA